MKNLILLLFILFSSPIYAATQPVTAKQGMVVSEHRLASLVGIDILRAGGNAIDAAIAVGYALAVVNPCCGNIGGGGFMTLHLADGKEVFINFREKAPLRATKTMFLKNKVANESTQGYLAVATPGTVLGLDAVLQKYGTMTRKQVMAPAIRLATEGFLVTPYLENQLQPFTDRFRKQPNVAAIFLKNNNPLKTGDRLIQKDLARTLTLISESGPTIFYRGAIAITLVNASNAHNGLLSLKDFSNYNISTSAPLHCEYHGYTIISATPPSSGGITLCEMLMILENLPLAKMGYHSFISTRSIVEALRYSYADRNSKLGDPDFVHNPIEQLLSPDYTKNMSDTIIHSNSVPKVIPNSTTHELTDTTHYSVIDNKGNAVAVTYTINGLFGAGVIAGDTGFFLNNEMDDFTTQPGVANKFNLIQHDANAIQPGKRPLSSMSPTIVMKDGRVFMVLGSPGGPRIITAVLLTILNVLDYGMNIQQAVDAPRFHFQGSPNEIDIEPYALPFTTIKQLEFAGYPVVTQHTWSAVEAIVVGSDGTFYGANDVRRPDGEAAGY